MFIFYLGLPYMQFASWLTSILSGTKIVCMAANWKYTTKSSELGDLIKLYSCI